MSAHEPRINGVNEWKGAYGASSKAREMVADTQAEWEKVWRRMNGKMVPMPAAPQLPAGAAVVAVFVGSRNSGGYAAEIVDIYEDNGKLKVDWCEHRPAPGAMTTMALTSPYHVRLIEDKDLPVEFNQVPPGTKPRREIANDNEKPQPKPDRPSMDKDILDRIRRRRVPKL